MKLSALDEALFELPNLIAGIRHGSEGPKHSFSYWGTVEGISRGEDMLLDRRGQAQHAHDLVYAGSRDPLPSGNVGLVGDLAGLQEGLPFDGLAEELDHPGCFGLLWRLWVAPAAMEGVYDLVGGHPARQGADVAVFEGPLGSRGRSLRSVHGRRPRGRLRGHSGWHGRLGSRPPDRPIPGGFAYCYTWGPI